MPYGNEPVLDSGAQEGTQLNPSEYYQQTGRIPVGATPRVVQGTGTDTPLPWDVVKNQIVTRESGDKNVPNYRYDSTHTAGGYYQITDTNWKNYGPKAGVDLSQYPNALAAPKEVQEKVAKSLYDEQGIKPWSASMGGYGGQSISGKDWNVDPHAILTEQGRSDTTVVGMSPAEYLALTPDVEDTGTNKAKKLSLEKSIKAGDMIEDIPSLDVKGGRVYDQDGRHRAMLAQQQGVDLIPVALHGIVGDALPEKIAGMKGNELPVQWKPWPAVKPDIASPYANQQGTPEQMARQAQNRSLFGEGIMNVVGQAARLGERVLPQGVNTAINSVIAPGRTGTIDEIEQARLAEQAKEDQENPGGAYGMRTAGQVVAELPLAMLGGTSIPGLMASGAAAGALSPVPGPNLLEGTLENAGVGGVLGGALGYVGKTIPEIIDLGKKVLPKIEQQAKAAIEKAFSQGSKGGGPSSADVVNAVGEARALGKPVNLLDVGPEPVRQLAKRAASAPGPARELATQATQARSRAFVNNFTPANTARISKDINNLLGTDAAKATVDQLVKEQSAEGRPLWDKALKGGSIAPLRPILQKAFTEAAKTTKAATENLAKAKQALESAPVTKSIVSDKTRFAQDKVKEAEQAFTTAVTRQNNILKFVEKAKEDGTLNAPGAIWSPTIQESFSLPEVKKGLAEGYALERSNAFAEGRAMNNGDYSIIRVDPDGNPVMGTIPTMKTLAVVKQGLDKMIEETRDPITGRLSQRGRSFAGVRDRLLKEIDRLNPDYKPARDAWAGKYASMNAVKYGQEMFDRDLTPDEVLKHWNSLTPSEQKFMLVGVRDKLTSDIGNKVFTGDPSSAILNTPYKLEKLYNILGNKATPLVKGIEYEHLMERTNKMFPRSTVGQGGEGNLEEDYMVGANVLRGVRHLTHADIPGALSSFLYAGRNLLRRNNPELNLAIMRILHDPNATVQSSTAPGVRLLSSLNLPKTNETLAKGSLAAQATQRMLPYLNTGIAASQSPYPNAEP